ncbi:MAG: helix-turn-helix transcriptional regulator [Pseudomonadales bacterium]
MDLFSQTVRSIYSSVTNPAGWTETNALVAQLIGCNGISLSTLRETGSSRTLNSSVYSSLKAEDISYYADNILPNDDIAQLAYSHHNPTVFSANTVLGDNCIRESQAYQEFYQDHGFGRFLAVALEREGNMVSTLSVQRDFSDTPFRPAEYKVLNDLLPHLTRAVSISRKVDYAVSEARLTFEAADKLSFPIIIVDENRTILQRNSGAEAAELAGDYKVKNGNISLPDVAADALLETIISPKPNAPLYQIDVAYTGLSGGKNLVQCIPLNPAVDYYGRGSEQKWLLLFLHEALTPTFPVEFVIGLYGLSPAEGRVCGQLIQGLSALEMARNLHLSMDTVRFHLKSIYRKANVTGQAQLMARLLNSFFGRYS